MMEFFSNWLLKIQLWFADIRGDFIQSFIEKDRWKLMVKGLGVTLQITILALIIGVVLGVVVAIIRSSYDQMQVKPAGPGGFLLRLMNFLCKVYLTVIRGTPVMVQLLIMFFVIMVSTKNTTLVAVLTFGINSGAYVAEIVRGGIMSIDAGQMEAGRSLGFGYVGTMWYIIIPQAFRNILPSLGNELITLLKETSIVTVIGAKDLTKGAMNIQGATYQAFMPFIAAAAIYLMVVMLLSWLLGKLERRLRNSER